MANDKGTTHGNFVAGAELTMKLKDEIQRAGSSALDYPSREALDQILSRIARIVCGDQTHAKHWRDIQGFCQVRLDAVPPTTEIESDIRKLVRSLPTVRMEKTNGTP
jgi:hypothetical protein